jgi:hypothetical protein
MDAVRDVRRDLTQPRQRAFRPRLVAGDENNSRALARERLSGDLPNPRRGPSDDNNLSVHDATSIRPSICSSEARGQEAAANDKPMAVHEPDRGQTAEREPETPCTAPQAVRVSDCR